MNIAKKSLKNITALYVEDDTYVREELCSLLSNFFKKIYTAKDGLEALELYNHKKDEIDLIISDINMPNMTGIEFVKEVRKTDKETFVIFATAHSDYEYLSESIKLKIHDYVIKPIDVRDLLFSVNELSEIINNKLLLKEQNQELAIFKEAIDHYNILIKTDESMNITYVNKLFCDITGFDEKELIGKSFSVLKHEEMDVNVYDNIQESITSNNFWHGTIKQVKKDNEAYIVDTYIISTNKDSEEIAGTICIQRDITKAIVQKREVQSALMKDKGDMFKRSKEDTAFKDKQIQNLEDEIKRLGQENTRLINNIKDLEDDGLHKKIIVLNKENSDLSQQVLKLETEMELLKNSTEKQISNSKIKHDTKIEQLTKQVNDLKKRYDLIEDEGQLIQKAEYWKLKAEYEAKKVAQLELDVLQNTDKSFIKKILGD